MRLLIDDLVGPPARPPTLLSPPQPHLLRPYAVHSLPSSSLALAIHPAYDLSNPASTLFLTSIRDLPIRLLNPFAPEKIATYPLITPTTERFVAPHSLVFDPWDSGTFIAGTSSQIAIFDLTRDGEEPVLRLPTARGRIRAGSRVDAGGTGLKGIISALAIDPTSHLLAAGTFTRKVALYDARGQGAEVATFSLNGPGSRARQNGQGEYKIGSGTGVTQLHFLSSPLHSSPTPSSPSPSPPSCASPSPYLLLTERESTGLSLYDIRHTGRRLSWLACRPALTKQRLAVDVASNPSTTAPEVYAGGTDGYVRVWERLGAAEGLVMPSRSMRVATAYTGASARQRDCVVGAVGVHPLGARVMVTGSGSRKECEDRRDDGGDDSRDGENGGLKVWAL